MFVSAMVMASCSETDGEENEYANWQERNDTYFASVYAQAESAIANGDTNWKIIRCYSKSPDSKKQTDYIVAKVKNNGTNNNSVAFTDSVKIHYRGRLMPTTNYAEGYQFDSSWTGDYDLQTMNPYKGVASNFIKGFSTALMNMHTGDRWEVYIPYELGYNESESGSIPAYSTLVFDLTLVKAWR